MLSFTALLTLVLFFAFGSNSVYRELGSILTTAAHAASVLPLDFTLAQPALLCLAERVEELVYQQPRSPPALCIYMPMRLIAN